MKKRKNKLSHLRFRIFDKVLTKVVRFRDRHTKQNAVGFTRYKAFLTWGFYYLENFKYGRKVRRVRKNLKARGSVYRKLILTSRFKKDSKYAKPETFLSFKESLRVSKPLENKFRLLRFAFQELYYVSKGVFFNNYLSRKFYMFRHAQKKLSIFRGSFLYFRFRQLEKYLLKKKKTKMKLRKAKRKRKNKKKKLRRGLRFRKKIIVVTLRRTENNMFITAFRNKKLVATFSSGKVGQRGPRKLSKYSAELMAKQMGRVLRYFQQKDYKFLLELKSPYRDFMIKTACFILKRYSLGWLGIINSVCVAHNGCRVRKKRRK